MLLKRQHKSCLQGPLVKLLGDKKMEDINNMRLLRLKEKILPYHFRVVHRPGLKHTVPDYASRYPSGPPNLFLADYEHNMVEEVEVAVHDLVTQQVLSSKYLAMISTRLKLTEQVE